MKRTELIKATLADYEVVQNMARFYAYDMSRDCGQQLEGWEFPKNGLYECNDFKKYLEGNENHAFLIKIDDELAGFVFVNKLEVMPEVDWNMGEFFIVAKFQRSGIGRSIAKQVFDQFPGEWSVGAILQNARALNFWRKIIAEYTRGKFHEVEKKSEQLKTAEHPDPYPMIILRFKASQSTQKATTHTIKIRQLVETDISTIVNSFDQIGWNKPATLFQEYLKEQTANERYVWVAFRQNQFIGYITLKVHSEYLPFAKKNIPEIKDLNVLPTCRNQGIGSALMKKAEEKASVYNTQVGIGVGLTLDYGNAQRLYVKGGYIPDGNGVTYQHESVKWGIDYKVDDDLVLWFIKDLPMVHDLFS